MHNDGPALVQISTCPDTGIPTTVNKGSATLDSHILYMWHQRLFTMTLLSAPDATVTVNATVMPTRTRGFTISSRQT